jgi:hypothetical protein
MRKTSGARKNVGAPTFKVKLEACFVWLTEYRAEILNYRKEKPLGA